MTVPSPEDYCPHCGLLRSAFIPCGHTDEPAADEPVLGVLTGQVPVRDMPVAMKGEAASDEPA